METSELIIMLGGIILIGVLGLMGIIMSENNVIELGSAICEQEYNLSYEKYQNDILYCKGKKENYDGLKIQLNNNGGS